MQTMNMNDLRTQILNDLDQIRAGKLSKGEARVIIGMHRNLIETLKVDLAYANSQALDIKPVEIILRRTKLGIAAE
jgi:hypothetical protein